MAKYTTSLTKVALVRAIKYKFEKYEKKCQIICYIHIVTILLVGYTYL